nr:lamin tail domain-containing protein [uncultured Porphyromonas sp.]
MTHTMHTRKLLLVLGLALPQLALAHPLLSEVMAAPNPASAEYVELYNPSDQPCPLGDYLLAVGKEETHVQGVRLPDVKLPPHSYIVLCAEPQRLTERYPRLTADQVLRLGLPRLVNSRGVVALIKEGEELVVDKFVYDSSSLPRGLKTKKDVAWERVDLSAPWESAQWLPALAAAGYASPGQPNSVSLQRQQQPKPPSAGGRGELEAETEERNPRALRSWLEQHPAARCSWIVYELTGQTIHQGESSGSHAWLEVLCTEPRSFFDRLGLPAGSSYLLSIRCEEAGAELLSYAFLISRP